MKEIFDNLFYDGKKVYTKTFLREKEAEIYAKSLKRYKNFLLREWDPYKSKPCAAILKGIKTFPFKRGSKVLYLGIASGSTASFISDIVDEIGIIYGVEISEENVRDLISITKFRKNIVPINANARIPEKYYWIESIDIVYQDIATDDQENIFIRNCKKFLKENGYGVIAIKARSIDATKKPKIVFKHVIEEIGCEMKLIEKTRLEPYEKDHMLAIFKLL